MVRTLLMVCLAAVLVLAYALYADEIRIPDRWNPWAPLRIEEPFNWLTHYKLARLSKDPALCRAVLAQAEMRYRELPDRETGEGCGLHNAVRVEATSARISEPFMLSCRSAVAVALWEYHVLQPGARAHFGQKVARLEHLGSYSCRNVYGREGARRSRHATADALDIAGFVLENGRRISVARDWSGNGAESQFLREIHKGACRVFDGVLGPQYNDAHRDHLHLDKGSFRICR
jgi:hypothetical protein